MIGFEIGIRTGEELVRFIGALGRHRYVASRLHLVHAFVFEAVDGTTNAALADAVTWAQRALSPAGGLDLASKDERLWRKASDPEVAGALEILWGNGDATDRARERLRTRLESIDALPPPSAAPFDESSEDEMFPVLVDAGWELLPLAHLDPERHKGAIQSFDDFEVARFEEESAVPPVVTLHELPLLGAVELLEPFDDFGETRAPFVLWQQGHETYLDYVLRGVLKVAKIQLELEESS